MAARNLSPGRRLENKEAARLFESEAYRVLSYRANVISWLKGMLLYVAHGYRWDKTIENNTKAYINNVSRLTGINPDEPIGIPSEQPSRWIALGIAMAIQETGTESLDYFAMLRGWELCRQDAQSGMS